MKKLSLTGLGLVALSMSAHVSATPVVRAEAHVQNLTYTVTDLRPDDGVAASFRLFSHRPLSTVKSNWFTEEYDYFANTIDDAVQSSTSGNFFNSLPLDAALSSGQGAASRSNSGLSTSVALDSTAFEMEGLRFLSSGYRGGRPVGGPVVGSAVTLNNQLWELSAGAEVRISALLNLSAYVDTTSVEALTQGGPLRVSGSSWVEFTIWRESSTSGDVDMVGTPLSYGVNARQYVSPLGSGDRGQAEAEQNFSFDYILRNNSNTRQLFNLGLLTGSSAGANRPPAPVPEPSSWALAVCGLVVAGLYARRRTV